MEIQTNKSLLEYNTFGINVKADFFIEVKSIDDLLEILKDEKYQQIPRLVLGGGSNVLFTQDFNGLVLKNDLKGIKILSESDSEVVLEVGAGENWHEFVMHCVDKDYAGIENLSLIPGNVGASPMQNIGAYGVEVKDVVQKVKFIHFDDLELHELDENDCEFGYRTSVFKTSLKNKTFISSVVFKLKKQVREFNTSYGAIEKELESLGLSPSVQNISKAVINIRRSKLPDPKEIGNAGSFFKNPVISNQKAEELKGIYADIPLYPAGEGKMKVAAGWMIEKAGWKGKRINGYGVHEKQALVLVNYKGAKGSEVNQLAEDIRESILDNFGIELEKEVNIL